MGEDQLHFIYCLFYLLYLQQVELDNWEKVNEAFSDEPAEEEWEEFING